ncbi:TerC/Alx family metal homeostasis membrane protein [Actinophytocola algeriensis]|uniref:Tellurite resistance protein TerC n=1 Tax=Actinophytocola algeriensis TaxID=1768010 RepID=A0A7W7Q169_9PSEU|nr:TerC/Alx family metal homeostasis membrane protein [Actinophytocola algeriensis]MBB4904968.1 tellurite resistance protein TerC [Actinophytocola algeriensis]MBE1476172.1 tellurite resistance protein TerC [Actinophytocola algeriensis]
MDFPVWVWVATLVGLTALIVGDLVVVGRRPREVSVREASLWVAACVGLAVLFGLALLIFAGSTAGAEFFAGYVTEYSLSVDNLFVFVIIMAKFAVPRQHQHRVLFIGIVLSLVLRGVCIAAGAAALAAFNWIFYVFGAFLIYTAIKVAKEGKGEEEPEAPDNALVRALGRILPTSDAYDGGKVVTKVGGRRVFTPMIMVVSALGIANVVFALDSIPAIFGLTTNGYIVFTANALALLGLRQLYFVIGGLLERLVYLSYGLSVILGFIGVKLIIEALHGSHVERISLPVPHIGIALSLGIIVVVLVVTTIASLLRSRSVSAKQEAEVEEPELAGTP